MEQREESGTEANYVVGDEPNETEQCFMERFLVMWYGPGFVRIRIYFSHDAYKGYVELFKRSRGMLVMKIAVLNRLASKDLVTE